MSAYVSAAIDVQRVLIVGAGTMGTGIAQVAARAGYRTEIFDVASGAAQRSLERVGDSLARAVEKGRCTAEERAQALQRLTVAPELDAAAATADLIVEAAPEDLELKKQLFARFSRSAQPDAILATNTSSLPITAIASAAKGPERVVGLHFFNPVPAMKLLEIVQGERTHPMVVTAARAVGARLGKEVVVVRDAPGSPPAGSASRWRWRPSACSRRESPPRKSSIARSSSATGTRWDRSSSPTTSASTSAWPSPST